MMEVDGRKVYSLFAVVFLMGLLVALDLPTSFSSPDDFAGFLAIHPKLIPFSVVLAAIPFLFLRRALEAKH